MNLKITLQIVSTTLLQCLLLINPVVGKHEHHRIIGGLPAQPGQFPYAVSLHSATGSHFCGGSIVTRRFVLTAAHCFIGMSDALEIIIQAGTIHTHLSPDGTSYKVSKVITPTRFNPKTLEYDVALVKTSTAIELTRRVKLIRMAPRKMDVPLGAKVTAAGWGLAQIEPTTASPKSLQYLTLKTVSRTGCTDGVHVVDSKVICAGGDKGHDMCHGDSGGPIVYRNILVGLTSHSAPCALGIPTAFSKVSAFRDWIDGKIGHRGNYRRPK